MATARYDEQREEEGGSMRVSNRAEEVQSLQLRQGEKNRHKNEQRIWNARSIVPATEPLRYLSINSLTKCRRIPGSCRTLCGIEPKDPLSICARLMAGKVAPRFAQCQAG